MRYIVQLLVAQYKHLWNIMIIHYIIVNNTILSTRTYKWINSGHAIQALSMRQYIIYKYVGYE